MLGRGIGSILSRNEASEKPGAVHVSDGERTYEWNSRNELTAIASGAHRTEFSYDGKQRRIRAVELEEGVTQDDRRVMWCDDVICEERSGSGAVAIGRHFRLGEQSQGVAKLFMRDHLGSIREAVGVGGGLLARYDYQPWGKRSIVEGAEATSAGYTGHRALLSASLALTRFRAYAPELGRWISDDPVKHTGEFNLQAYVSNAPIVSVDPLGLSGKKVGSDVAYYICCKNGKLAVCPGPAYTNDPWADKCRREHEDQHMADMSCDEDRYCKGQPNGPVTPNPAEKRFLECRGYKEQMRCLEKQGPTKQVMIDRADAKKKVESFCPPGARTW